MNAFLSLSCQFFMVLRHAKRIHLAIKGKSCYNTTEKLNLNMMG